MLKLIRSLFGDSVEKPTDARKFEAGDKLYDQCIEIRNFEISNLVSRNNFFMVFQGVLIAGVIQASGSAPPIVQFLGSAIGLSLSIFQFMTASGAKFWQEAWEEQLNKAEDSLSDLVTKLEGRDFQRLFTTKVSDTENHVKSRLARESGSCLNGLLVRRFSVSRAPIYAALAFIFFWLLMLLFTLDISSMKWILSHITGFPRCST